MKEFTWKEYKSWPKIISFDLHNDSLQIIEFHMILLLALMVLLAYFYTSKFF